MKKSAFLSRTVFQLDERWLVKFEPAARTIMHKFYRRLIGGSLPFLNEMYFHLANESCSKIMVDVDHKIMFIPVDGSETTILSESLDLSRVYSLCSWLQSKRWHGMFSPIEQLIFYSINSPTFRTIREIIFASKLHFFQKVKLLNLLARLSIRNNMKNSCPVILHNDLSLHNILTSASHPVMLIDFEDSILEHKWIFLNLSDLVLELNPAQSIYSLHQIISSYAIKNSLEIDEFLLFTHAAYGYIRFHVRRVTMKRLNEQQVDFSLQTLEKLHEVF